VARNIIDDAAPGRLQVAQDLENDSRRLGLGNLTAAESLNSPYGLTVQRLLEQTRAVMQQRGPAAATAMDALTESMAPDLTPRQGAQAVQDGATGAINDLRQQRSAAGSPLYQSAFESTRPIGIDPTPVINRALRLGDENPSIRPILDRMTRTVMRDRYGRPITDLEQLQNGVKEWLDNQIGFAQTSGQPKLVRALTDAQGTLLGVLDNASREYANARAVWQQLSGPVTDAENGMIGQLSQDRALGDSAKIFLNPKNETPADIRNAGMAISAQNPQAVPALVKQYLQDKLDLAKKAVTNDTSRLGANFNAKTMGAVELNPREAANIEAAIRLLPDGDNVWRGFERTMQVFRTQGNRYVPGSPTAYNQAVQEGLKSNGLFGVSSTIEAASNPFRFAVDRIRNARLRSTYSVLDRVFSSPDSLNQLVAIAREPNRRRVGMLVGSLMAGDTAAAQPMQAGGY
jgi:hypothetical protein